MEYINRNLQRVREQIVLDKLNIVVPVPVVSVKGETTFKGPITGSSLYLSNDLIVEGRIVTFEGVFGATANALIEPVDDMIVDGGEF